MSLSKAPLSCFGFEWIECGDNPLDVLDESACPEVIEKRIEINFEPVRIEIEDSILEKFNELSEEELEFAFGKFTPVQSLNPYMTKLSFCSITEVGLFSIARIRKICVRHTRVFSRMK